MNRRIAGSIMSSAYALLGEPVREQLAEFERTQWLPPEELEAERVRLLRELLARASHHSPFYRRALEQAGLRAEDVTRVADLERLPTLTKDEVRENADELIGSAPRDRHETRKTSGSTGLPLKLEKSRITTGAMNALMWRNYGWFGIRMGDPQARVWLGSPSRLTNLKIRISDLLQNRIRLSSFAMGAEQFDGFIDDLRAFRPEYLYGYGQSVYRLAEYADANDRKLEEIGLKAVIPTGEMTSELQREVMARAFGTTVVNEYGCTELGIIAMDCPEGSMHTMDDGLIVEILRDGEPVAPGEEGEIVVTELYGSLMPLIRYRTGDRGVRSTRACSCGRALHALEGLKGRVQDLLKCADGTLVDPYTFEFAFKSDPEMYAAVRQWRVKQEGPSQVRITVCTVGAERRPDIETRAQQLFDDLTRRQLELVFDYEEWLEPKATGKSR